MTKVQIKNTGDTETKKQTNETVILELHGKAKMEMIAKEDSGNSRISDKKIRGKTRKHFNLSAIQR